MSKVDFSASKNDRLCFNAEYYDHLADLTRKYQLFFYPIDNSIELFDIRLKKPFMKRIVYPSIRLEDLYVGSVVNVSGRQLEISDTGDHNTKQKLEGSREQTLALIKPDAFEHAGKIVDAIYRDGFRIFKMKKIKLTRSELEEWASVCRRPSSEFSDVMIVIVLSAVSCVQKWLDLVGPDHPSEARKTNIDSLRALYGRDPNRNAVYGSQTPQDAKQEVDFFFGQRSFPPTAVFNEVTCGVIKPHAVLSGKAGQIMQAILDAGWEITAVESIKLEHENTAEFYEVYKGVVNEYMDMVDELSSGPSVVMEIRRRGTPNLVQAFRELCGPQDPNVGKILRSSTLRAVYGEDRIKNAIHCTDLEGDAISEVEYFFKILQ
ncbi:hypothetical protein PROFUN_08747 [Planoprotostelium fungivorum]|uniref:DM10 domain-containing protein n=1 Tax=Planoprotostelium fungivorum TaxID=1890364 RepID=A0A2P6ND46_9EUKA|nr:hypothetical protein PROFUN_08747 [Planoprotostelium fungivorum]